MQSLQAVFIKKACYQDLPSLEEDSKLHDSDQAVSYLRTI